MSIKEKSSIINVLDRSTLLSIIIISLLVSLLSLIIPIAAQTLVNLIAFGKLLQPVVTLGVAVFVLMMGLGALNIWQIIMAEIIQQRLMVKISHNLTHQFTHLSLNNFSNHHGPELVNRFFEIITMQKSLATLVIYGINLGLQLFLGLLLLVLYHPLFLLLDALIVLGILVTIFIPYRKALDSAKKECVQKHQIGAWLEEILLNRFLFRFNGYSEYASEQTDKKLVLYLQARNLHIKQLIKHQIGFYTLSALTSSLLLGLGGYLVINNQLSLGQLVAAEIVLGGLIYGLKRFGTLLENYYDLVVSANKVDSVLSLPSEALKVQKLEELFIPIKTFQLQTAHAIEAEATLDKPLLVYSADAVKCRLFTEQLVGFKKNSSLKVFVNNIACTQRHLITLRRYSLFINEPQWFAGTIYDNLVLNYQNITNKTILDHLNDFGLLEKVMSFADGLDTVIYEWPLMFTELEVIKLMVIRAMLHQPQLLVIDRAFDLINVQETDQLITHLLALKNTLLIVISQHTGFKHITNHLVLP